jgi:hypothetical protein
VAEDTGASGTRSLPRPVFSDHLGPSDELSECKLAELYEQLGRIMVERDSLLTARAQGGFGYQDVQDPPERTMTLFQQCSLARALRR